MTKVKICGIQTVDDAIVAFEEGADFIGLNFVGSSPRRIDFEIAREIVYSMRKQKIGEPPAIVGVFKDHSYEYVNLISDNLKLDFVQLHGQESIEYCALMKTPVIKAFNLPYNFDLTTVINVFKRFKVSIYLIDREKQGSGNMLNLKKANELCKLFPVIFSGGLTVENVGRVVHSIRPFGVDVASGIESNGSIDRNKVKRFLSKVRMEK